MDKLESIFERQQAFDDELIKKRNLWDITLQEWMQKESIALMVELAELLEEVQYKWWKNPKPMDMQAVKEELVDILHFFVSMCLKTGMSANELHDLYLRKNQENFNRQMGISEKKGYEVE